MKILKLTPPTKDYIWGGTRLSKEFDMVTFTDKQAEACMLSCHSAGECIIENGEFQGRTLTDVLQNEGKSYLGTNCEKFEDFPILICYFQKLIPHNYSIVRISINPVTSKISLMVSFTFLMIISPCLFITF